MLEALKSAAQHGFTVKDNDTDKPLTKEDEHRIAGALLSTVETDSEAKFLLKTYRKEGLEQTLKAYVDRRIHTAHLRERAKRYSLSVTPSSHKESKC